MAILLALLSTPASATVFEQFRAAGERLQGQSSSDSSSTTIAFPGFLDGAEGAMSVVARVGFNVNADAGPGAGVSEAGVLSYEIAFALIHTQSFDLILDVDLRGQLLRLADQEGCVGSVSLPDIAIPFLVRERDGAAFPIDVVLAGDGLASGGSNTGVEVSRHVTRTINFRNEPVGSDIYRINFTVEAAVLSQSCEVSARFGAANGSTTDCQACVYPGDGNRALNNDGVFFTITKIGLCGDGDLNAGEACDLGGGNGAADTCCSAACEIVAAGRICRRATSECDVIEACDGDTALCPEDSVKTPGTVCTSDGNECTDDVCSPAAQCIHVPLEGVSCENDSFCDGTEFCTAEGECVNGGPPPCRGQICDEEIDACLGSVATPTATPPVEVTATATAPSGATPTATRIDGNCAGDCNGDRMVAINELVLGVNIALGSQPITACPAFDGDGDTSVAINELVGGVSNALAGCR